MKITIEHYNTKVTVECSDDMDATQLACIIKGMLVTQGWGVELVNRMFAPDEE